MKSKSVKITHLYPHQYLPGNGNQTDSDVSWSVALNLAVWLKVKVKQPTEVTLSLSYRDVRGKQAIPIDHIEVEVEQELLFSNLVKIPVKGPLENMDILLAGVGLTDAELQELFVKVVEIPDSSKRLSGMA
ncbi:hypothetical protein [Pleionea sp. CnH1-48]|uniref:hypothetical protein n=1 Tax=Pleionea sp. CnH1-48 TaxID=2954494 RepID=UPI002098525E|nr:hypothetical protein [Pleionea sp. CnH1-48]MCO7223105.1 hypothetical protein [Pleionea sp. CnH1-48]